MKREDMIRKALQNIANHQVSRQLDFWPMIQKKINGMTQPKSIIRNRLLKASIPIFIPIFTMAAIFFYRAMVDHGLQAVQEAGLVEELNRTAQPFIYLGKASKPDYTLKTDSKLSATLNWAYADINRVAFQLTVNGLTVPQNVNMNEIVCIPNIRQDSGEELISYSPETYPIKIDAGKSDRPIELTYLYVFRHPIDDRKQKNINFDISFRFGACNPMKWNDYVGPTPVPIPSIASFEVSFQIPIHPGRVLNPHQSAIHSNLALNLDEISLSPSFVVSRVCFDPNVVDVPDPSIVLIEALIEENRTIIPNNQSTPPEPEMVNDNLYCQRIWFPSGVGSKLTKLELTINQITFFSDFGPQKIVKGPWTFTIDLK